MKKVQIYNEEGKLNTGNYLGIMAITGVVIGVTVQLGTSAIDAIRTKYREHKFKKLAKQIKTNLETLENIIKESE